MDLEMVVGGNSWRFARIFISRSLDRTLIVDRSTTHPIAKTAGKRPFCKNDTKIKIEDDNTTSLTTKRSETTNAQPTPTTTKQTTNVRSPYSSLAYLLIVLKTGTYMYLTTLLDPSSCTLSK
jgi:hypothetical protein